MPRSTARRQPRPSSKLASKLAAPDADAPAVQPLETEGIGGYGVDPPVRTNGSRKAGLDNL